MVVRAGTANSFDESLPCFDYVQSTTNRKYVALWEHTHTLSYEPDGNIFSIGNRMKGGRACWSIKGGNHLAILLRAYHTDKQFHVVPIPLPKQTNEHKPLSAAKIKETVGKGYEMPHNIHFPPRIKFVKEFSRYSF